MVGIDYIGLISLIAKFRARFVCIVVNYTIKMMAAEAVIEANLVNTVKFFNQDVVKVYKWPRTVYNDNGSHFQRFFKQALKENGVKQIQAPTTHPQSVSLAERYVQKMIKQI